MLCKLLRSLSYEVVLYTNRDVWENCKQAEELAEQNYYLQREGESKFSFIRRYFKIINESQLIIFTTLVDELRAFSRMNFRPPSLLLIHNGHTFLDPFNNIVISWKGRALVVDLLRLLHQLFFRISFWRRQLLDSFTFIAFTSEEVKKYLQERYAGRLEAYQILPALPLAFYNGRSSLSCELANCITIGIPGGVHQTGKNYDWVVQAFSRLQNRKGRRLELVLVGNAGTTYGQIIASQLNALSRVDLEVIYFESALPQVEFDQIMRRTDFLILPMRPYLKLGICQERYGYSNISGGVNDMIRFGIPALIPTFYPLPEDLEDFVGRYANSRELLASLEDWIEDLPFLELKRKAPEVLREYSKEVVLQRTAKLVEQMLDFDGKGV